MVVTRVPPGDRRLIAVSAGPSSEACHSSLREEAVTLSSAMSTPACHRRIVLGRDVESAIVATGRRSRR